MHEALPFAVLLIVLIVLLVLLAKKIKIAFPILLVLAGLALCFIPQIPHIKIEPDLIFFIFLPPLLFEASWAISIKQLKKWWRIIGSFAFLVVFFTAGVVAVCANQFIPGFSLALGFLLGGIVSPPDAVSAGAVLKFVKIPKSTSSILEGESLLNDASSLIIVRFALIAVGTGQFIFSEALVSFGWMAVGGSLIGLAMGWIFEKFNKILPTDAPADIALSLIYPYVMYWGAEQLHTSGVLAVVFGGLYLSANRFHYMNSSSRIAAHNVWESFAYILNGLVFMLIGLQMPEILRGLATEGIPFWTAVKYGLLVTATLVLVRIISSYIAMLSTFLFRRNTFQKMNMTWIRALKMPVILGWTGMRGVVSLAAALAIPEFLENGQPFPFRHLILFITFIVILLTLIVQGLTLPIMIKKIGVVNMDGDDEDLRFQLKKELSEYCLKHAKTHFGSEVEDNLILKRTIETWEEKLANPEKIFLTDKQKEDYFKFLELQRNFLIDKNKHPDFNEDIIRRQQFLIDLEEERVLNS